MPRDDYSRSWKNLREKRQAAMLERRSISPESLRKVSRRADRGNSHCMRGNYALSKESGARCIWKLNSHLGNSTTRRDDAEASPRLVRSRACTCVPRAAFRCAHNVFGPSASTRASINPPWHANNSWKKSSGHAVATLQLITRLAAATPIRLPGLQFVTVDRRARATRAPAARVDNASGSSPVSLFHPSLVRARTPPGRPLNRSPSVPKKSGWVRLARQPRYRRTATIRTYSLLRIFAAHWFHQWWNVMISSDRSARAFKGLRLHARSLLLIRFARAVSRSPIGSCYARLRDIEMHTRASTCILDVQRWPGRDSH